MEEQINIAITILASLLTGGFILFFVENQHVERDVIDRFKMIMNPYYRKLSCYLSFVFFIQNRIRYEDTKTDYIPDVKTLIPSRGFVIRSSGNYGFVIRVERRELKGTIVIHAFGRLPRLKGGN